MTITTKTGPGVFPKGVDYYEIPEQFDVYSWSPDPVPERSPATQVHLSFGGGDRRMLIRFKSPRSISALINALADHRADVWPKLCEKCGGTGSVGVMRCIDCGGKGAP